MTDRAPDRSKPGRIPSGHRPPYSTVEGQT